MKFNKMTALDLTGKRILIRVDMNVPVKNGVIGDDTRIRASLPSIEHCLQQGAAVILMTHLGRPTEGQLNAEDTLTPVAARLSELLGKAVPACCRLAAKRSHGCRRRSGNAGKRALQRRREKEQGRAGPGLRQVVRCVRQRCIRHRTPRRSLDPRRSQIRPA